MSAFETRKTLATKPSSCCDCKKEDRATINA